MTGRRRSPAELAALVGFVLRPPAGASPRRRRPLASIDIEPAAPPEPVAPPRDRPPARSPGVPDPLPLADIDVIKIDAELSEPLYNGALAQLQRGHRSKLLDLRAARGIKLGLFDGLARDWRAPRGTVLRLGILLGFEQWAVLRNVAARRLRALADHGIAIEIFYAQQVGNLQAWFAGGGVRHDRLRYVIAWLRTDWCPGPIWPAVLSRTGSLIQAHAERDEVPEMLLELAVIARSLPGTEGAEQAAEHAGAALACIGDQPSRARCRALRTVAAATLALGHTAAGLALLETAIATAVVLRDPIEEGSARAEMGFHALRRGHAPRAEVRFRTALALVASEGPAHLRATLHHDLALALHMQRKDADQAERHAITALGLRPDPGSQLARKDRALIALIRARRASPRN
jgi:hypothetical protein